MPEQNVSNEGMPAGKSKDQPLDNNKVKVSKVKILPALVLAIWTFLCGFIAYSCRPSQTPCDLDALLYKGPDIAVVDETGSIPSPKSIGVVTSTGKEYYVEQSKSRNWREAFNYCDTVGMQLATIESKAEAQLLQDKTFKLFSTKQAWTAGVVNRSLSAFGWTHEKKWKSLEEADFMTLVYYTVEHEPTACLSFYPRKDECLGCWVFQRDCQVKLATICEKVIRTTSD